MLQVWHWRSVGSHTACHCVEKSEPQADQQREHTKIASRPEELMLIDLAPGLDHRSSIFGGLNVHHHMSFSGWRNSSTAVTLPSVISSRRASSLARRYVVTPRNAWAKRSPT